MKIDLGQAQDDVRIEIVPLIDVIFCILTFFILAAVGLTRQQAIEVDLPRSSTGQAQMRELAIVTLSPTGQLFFERQPVDRATLVASLEAFRQAKPTGTMVLYASQSAYYSEVVGLLDLMRSIGGTRVSLATLPTEIDGPPALQPSPVTPLSPALPLPPTQRSQPPQPQPSF